MRFIQSFSISLVSQGAVLLIGFINSILITRNLGVDGRGKYAIAMNIVLIFVLLFGDGIQRSNTYLISLDKKKLSTLFTNSSIAVLIIGGFLLLLPTLVGERLLAILVPGTSVLLIYIAIFSVIPFIFILSMQGIFLGLQKYYTYNCLVVTPLFVYLLLNISLLHLNRFSPEYVMKNYFYAMMFVGLLTLSWLIFHEKVRFRPNPGIARESISKGLKASVSQVSLFLLFRVDIFLLNYFLGVDKAGIYSVAVLMSELIQKLANTSGNVLFPKITGELTGAKVKLTIKVLGFVLVVGLLFSIFMYIGGRILIVFLYKEAFANSVNPLYYLLPGTILMAGGKVLLLTLWGQDFPRITMIVPLSTFILNAVLNIILIPQLGINGAAISTSISYCIFGLCLGIYFFANRK